MLSSTGTGVPGANAPLHVTITMPFALLGSAVAAATVAADSNLGVIATAHG
jgi:hypothetical protein